MQPIRKNETAFRIRVVNHDGFAVLGIKNIARPLRIGIGKILGRGDDAGDIDVRLQFADGLQGI